MENWYCPRETVCGADGQYFELHRGTYTSQAHTKRSNRYSEVMLREIEYFATLASIHSKDYKYPKKDLDDMWENVLLYLLLL